MRKNIINTQPYLILLLTCPIIALIAWLRRDYSADLQLYDTYFVVGMPFLAGALTTIILITSLIYWLTRHRTGLSQLTAAHVLGTIGIALYLISAMGTLPRNAANEWVPMTFQQHQAWQDLSLRFAMALVTFLAVQMIFAANLVVKWVKTGG